MIYSIYNQTKVFSGIYKLNFPNGKCYIGQSKNIIRRIREHNCCKRNYPIAHVIRKYGPRIEFELLEEINAWDVERLNDREKYYINYYNSTIYNNGYNLTLGGDGAMRDYNNPIVTFIKKELLKQDKTTQEIAEEAGVSISTVWHINNGETYREEQYNYPLRQKRVYHSVVLSKEQIQEIIHLLKHEYLIKMEDIGKQYNVSVSTIERINNGLTPYHISNEKYPIRKKGANFKKFSEKEIDEIINLLKNSNLSQIEIASKYQCERKIIREINLGIKYFREEEKYPIRLIRVAQGLNNQYISKNNTYKLKAISLLGDVFICESLSDLQEQTGLNRNTARSALFSGKVISQGKYKGWRIIPLSDEEYKNIKQNKNN